MVWVFCVAGGVGRVGWVGCVRGIGAQAVVDGGQAGDSGALGRVGEQEVEGLVEG